MSYGYSQRLVDANKKANAKSLGVALGRLCIDLEIPVSTVAEKLDVSRATIYNWFWGLTTPNSNKASAVAKMVLSLKNRK